MDITKFSIKNALTDLEDACDDGICDIGTPA